MIKVNKSFIIAAVAMTALGHGITFLLLFASITLHELAHVIAAKCFGGRFEGIRLTALGESALIQGIDAFAPWQRYSTYLAGPLVNFLLAWVSYALNYSDGAFYNTVLGLFNLLPIFPLDGGRLMHLYMGNRMGILRAGRILIKIGQAMGLLLFALGCVQAVLFPYNISLLCVGKCLQRENKRLMLALTFEFFRSITRKKIGLIHEIKFYTAVKETALQSVVERFNWDSLTYIRVDDCELAESTIMEYVLKNGLNGTLEDVLGGLNLYKFNAASVSNYT